MLIPLQGWQRKLDPDYNVMKTLQTLLFKEDWAKSLQYSQSDDDKWSLGSRAGQRITFCNYPPAYSLTSTFTVLYSCWPALCCKNGHEKVIIAAFFRATGFRYTIPGIICLSSGQRTGPFERLPNFLLIDITRRCSERPLS